MSQLAWAQGSMSALGHFRQIGTLRTITGCPLRSESGHAHAYLEMSALCHERTHAVQQKILYSITSSASSGPKSSGRAPSPV